MSQSVVLCTGGNVLRRRRYCSRRRWRSSSRYRRRNHFHGHQTTPTRVVCVVVVVVVIEVVMVVQQKWRRVRQDRCCWCRRCIRRIQWHCVALGWAWRCGQHEGGPSQTRRIDFNYGTSRFDALLVFFEDVLYGNIFFVIFIVDWNFCLSGGEGGIF